ncbi:SOS response-associated peptidase [candidate division KSB1 bacterium]|nr:SOS response-associated peptidase [candidate division KSB1 bacterium]NIR68970.1 SOS response-associated peptidase [candidate division KSB1 bacterium]NIS26756.1 SOS response-associated peptidase [candidate division KSB1 bacterium]NIT73504.1 SOS response-associated peptidase [candidate division KSB1 bacterium]NIU24695.1 SOS response-associated peptidase [candidate division KSB1 bacterium]
MCGRFYLKFLPSSEELFEHLFGIPLPEFEYPPILDDDILPYRDITTFYPSSNRVKSRPMFWNLIPKNSRSFEPRKTWFNTRKEKLAEPYQKNLLRYKRCVVPINGFFENKKANGKAVYHSKKIGGRNVRKKETYEFTLREESLMLLGGIYDVWGEDQFSCSIITLAPNSLIGEIHQRMPFILPNEMVKVWLDKNVDDDDFLTELISPFPSEKLLMKRKWPPDKEGALSNEESQMDLFGG